MATPHCSKASFKSSPHACSCTSAGWSRYSNFLQTGGISRDFFALGLPSVSSSVPSFVFSAMKLLLAHAKIASMAADVTITSRLQAVSRGYLLRKKIAEAREAFSSVAREIEGDSGVVEWNRTGTRPIFVALDLSESDRMIAEDVSPCSGALEDTDSENDGGVIDSSDSSGGNRQFRKEEYISIEKKSSGVTEDVPNGEEESNGLPECYLQPGGSEMFPQEESGEIEKQPDEGEAFKLQDPDSISLSSVSGLSSLSEEEPAGNAIVANEIPFKGESEIFPDNDQRQDDSESVFLVTQMTDTLASVEIQTEDDSVSQSCEKDEGVCHQPTSTDDARENGHQADASDESLFNVTQLSGSSSSAVSLAEPVQLDLAKETQPREDLGQHTLTRAVTSTQSNHAAATDQIALKKHREDLAFELLWIRQAIESRKEYLRIKWKMDKEECKQSSS